MKLLRRIQELTGHALSAREMALARAGARVERIEDGPTRSYGLYHGGYFTKMEMDLPDGTRLIAKREYNRRGLLQRKTSVVETPGDQRNTAVLEYDRPGSFVHSRFLEKSERYANSA